MKDVTRRQFIKISSGALGAVAAAEAVSLGAKPAKEEQAENVPIKTGKQVPEPLPLLFRGLRADRDGR